MYLLIIILNKEEWLDDVLSCLLELGVEDAIIIDSESMESALARKVPIFAGMRFDLKGAPYSKTIFTTTPDKGAGKKIVQLLKKVGIDLEEKGASRIIIIKTEAVIGTTK